MKSKVLFQRPQPFILLIIVVCFVLLGVSVWSYGPGQKLSPEKTSGHGSLNVKNKTKGFTVASIERQGDLVQIVFRNDYNKIITGYKVYVGNTLVQTEMLVNPDNNKVIAPGTTYQEGYPIEDELDTRGIVILAVIFDDKTTDGDPQYVQELQEYRSGMRMQRQYALRLLKKALKSPDNSIDAALDRVKSTISPLPEDEIEDLPANVKFGLIDERRRLLRLLAPLLDTHRKTIESSGDRTAAEDNNEFRQNLTRVVENYQRTLANL